MRLHPLLLRLATATLLFTLLPTPHSPFPTPAALAQTPQDRKAEADRWLQKGQKLIGKAQYPEALEALQQALGLYQKMADKVGKGDALYSVGDVYYYQAQYPRALEFYQQSLKIRQTTGDRKKQGVTLNDIGEVYRHLGQYPKALEFYQQALAIHKEVGDHTGEGGTLNNIGLVYNRLGQYAKALEFFQQALAIYTEKGVREAFPQESRSAEGTILNNTGEVYKQLGQYPKALEVYQQALAIAKEVSDRPGEGITLNNIGLVYKALGQYPQALQLFQQALAITKKVGDRPTESSTLNSIGTVYADLGQYPKALEVYQQALAILKEVGDHPGEGTTLNNIGGVYRSLRQYPQALQFFQQALAIAKEVGDLPGEGGTLNNIGEVYQNLGQYSKALEVYQQALAILKEVGDHPGEGVTLVNIGVLYKRLGQYPQALEVYQQALAILKEVGDRAGEGATLNNIGSLLTAQRQPELAIVFFKQSVTTYEAIRTDNRKLAKEQQESYTKTVADTYRSLADLLLKQDRILEAQQVLDFLKVQELKDYLQTVRGTGQTLYELPPEQAILQKYNALQTSAIQLGQELTTLRKLPETQRTPAQQERITKLVQLQEALNQQFNAFTDLPDVLALVKQLSPDTLRQTVDLKSLDALRDDLRQLHAVLLYPLILDDRLELIITTPDSPPLRRTVNVKRDDLNAALVEFRQALQNPRSNAKLPAQKLYNWLIKPLEADLKQANAQTIIYAPDAQLRYIPLAALYDGQQWLVQRYRINNITAKSFTEFKTQPIKQPHVLAGAFTTGSYTIPVGDRSFTFAGLPFAKKEIDILAALLPNTTRLFDQAFSRTATTSKMNDYNIVHLATHASFVPGVAANSFIVFGNGDKATLKDIESWTLNQVDLVVLSACETALGGKFGNGEEILGLGYQFQNRGAKATIASLWEVSDGGTQALMDAFYGALQTGKMTKAEALRQAQIALITGDYTAVGSKRASLRVSADSQVSLSKQVNDNLNHPYYWAPFILIGNGL